MSHGFQRNASGFALGSLRCLYRNASHTPAICNIRITKQITNKLQTITSTQKGDVLDMYRAVKSDNCTVMHLSNLLHILIQLNSANKIIILSGPTRTVSQIKKRLPRPQYLLTPLNISDHDYPPSCTSSGLILQLCKVPIVSVLLWRKGCANETYGQADPSHWSYMFGT